MRSSLAARPAIDPYPPTPGASLRGTVLDVAVAVGLAVVWPGLAWAQEPLEARFNASPTVGCATPHTVFFTDASTPAASLVSWTWDFGDGGSSSAMNPIHSYTAPGDYEVTLTVSDGAGSDTATTQIAVSTTAAGFTATGTFGCAPVTSEFTDTSTSTTALASWSWDFGDGVTSDLQNPSHTYDAPGIYTVTLQVTDANGCTDTAIDAHSVQAIGPAVDFAAAPGTGPVPLAVSFTDASTSGAPIIGRTWHFGDGAMSSAMDPMHGYVEPGAYDVALTVQDLDGCSRTVTKPGFVTATPFADLAVTVSDGVTSAVPGESITYTVVARNDDTSGDPAALLTDTFPAALSCSWTSVAAGGASGNTDAAGDLVAALDLPAGSSVTYTVACAIADDATGMLSNTATLASSGTDPDPSDDSATDDDTLLTPEVDLAVTITDGLATSTPGAVHTYTVVAHNSGPSAAPGAEVAASFPTALTDVTWTCVASPGSACPAAGSGDVLATVDLAVVGTATFTVAATVADAFVGPVSASASVAAGPGAFEREPADDTANDTTLVASPAAITATKAVTGDLVPGGAVVYTIVLANAAATPQLDNPGDELVDAMPAELVVESVAATAGTAVATGNVVTWNGDVPAGGVVEITIAARVLAGAAGATVSNQATVHFDADGDGANEASAPTTDPAVGGALSPTTFTVSGVLEIPTLGGAGLALLALLIGAAAVGRSRA